MHKKKGYQDTTTTSWKQDRDRLKTLWVICVLGFWFSVFLQAALYYLKGEINFILMSIVFGMMILGVALKARLQQHLRTRRDD
ncbi:MAG: hypothetical protein GY746_06130 [Gammaproteobacteria bacterium]|nr:hypothetical protein [Gammaproteobacteria bacterium]